MALHPTTFEYLKPTDEQLKAMTAARTNMKIFVHNLDKLMPDGADKTYVMRQLRELAMWINASITREADGTPRQPTALDPDGASQP